MRPRLQTLVMNRLHQRHTRQLAADPAKADAALNAAETAAQALWNALDGIERARVAKRTIQ